MTTTEALFTIYSNPDFVGSIYEWSFSFSVLASLTFEIVAVLADAPDDEGTRVVLLDRTYRKGMKQGPVPGQPNQLQISGNAMVYLDIDPYNGINDWWIPRSKATYLRDDQAPLYWRELRSRMRICLRSDFGQRKIEDIADGVVGCLNDNICEENAWMQLGRILPSAASYSDSRMEAPDMSAVLVRALPGGMEDGKECFMGTAQLLTDAYILYIGRNEGSGASVWAGLLLLSGKHAGERRSVWTSSPSQGLALRDSGRVASTKLSESIVYHARAAVPGNAGEKHARVTLYKSLRKVAIVWSMLSRSMTDARTVVRWERLLEKGPPVPETNAHCLR
ncbi:hypothetical protein EDD16DRAFT_1527760 [Pisolithus croceorrhizus]|nr:hypothetical protein EDD16DRAFT_1527760 [Pisolithus croceorrhizus]